MPPARARTPQPLIAVSPIRYTEEMLRAIRDRIVKDLIDGQIDYHEANSLRWTRITIKRNRTAMALTEKPARFFYRPVKI